MIHAAFKRLRGPIAGAGVAILAIGAASALAGSGVGGVFNLGQSNTVDAQTQLSGKVGGNPQLRVENSSSQPASYGVVGRMSSGSAESNSAGVRGLDDGYGAGVLGENRNPTPNGAAMFGVRGIALVTGGEGVSGNGNRYGVDGFSSSGAGVNGESATGDGVDAFHRGPGARPGLLATTSSSDANAVGAYGRVSSMNAGPNSAAVRGENDGTGGNGIGVWGSHAGSGTGVYGTSTGGTGVYGSSISGLAGFFAGPVRVTGYVTLKAITGAPPAADCDQASEAGRVVVRTDGTTNLYICRGTAGWIGK